MGVAETEEALRAEVSGVCRNYCLQVWNKALNLAEVKESRECLLSPAIRAPDSSISQDDATPKNPSSIDEIPTKDLPPSSSPPKRAKQAGAAEKEKENPKEVTPETTKPPTAPKDSSEGGGFPKP